MEQRVYYGPIDPNTLADYLVGIFQQPTFNHAYPVSMAQKINQGERVYVQIMRSGDWIGHEHGALSVQILRIAGGVSVSMGQADWLDLDQTDLAGMFLGALLFPPLLIFPMLRGLVHSGFSQEVWAAIEAYCVPTPARPAQPHAHQGFYCTYCGAFNHPAASHCHACQAPFNVAPPPQPAQPEQPAPPQPAPDEPAQPTQSTPVEPVPEVVICPSCGASVANARFCGNCAAPLHEASGQQG